MQYKQIFDLSEQNIFLNKKATVLAVSGFTPSPSTNWQCIQQIRKHQIAMLPSYFR